MTIDTTTARELVIKELKLEGLTPEEQNEIIDFLEENILVKINNDIFNLLDDEDKNTFVSLCETANNELIGAFVKKKIVDLDALIRRAAQFIIKDFKARMVIS